MDKKTSRFFTIFWIISGLAWIVGGLRYSIVKDDIVGGLINGLAALFSFILAAAYWRNLIEKSKE